MMKFWPGARSGIASHRHLGVLAAGLAMTGLLVAGWSSAEAIPTASFSSPGLLSGGTADCDSVTTCYTPHQLQVAYGVKPLLDRGINGRGQTIVLPELAQSGPSHATSDLRQDLALFDKAFGLPAARMRVVTKLAGAAAPWLANGEEVLDAEMVHVIAPQAKIAIVLVKGTALNNTPNAVASAVAALRLGLTEGGVISISAAGQVGGEHCVTRKQAASVHAALRAAADHHVTVVAASGDIGAVGEPCDLIKALTGGTFTPVREVTLPGSDPLVLAAGGTSLYASHKTGAYIRETAWGLPYGDPGSPFQASGGGFSRIYARPGYQSGVAHTRATRGVPDVSADASGHTGMAIIISNDGQPFLRNSGGTSASAPIWAALIALADQYAGRHLGFVNPAIYRIARSGRYHLAFHDITTGNNTVRFPPKTIKGYRAARGWDPVTGWGSPNANVLVPLLAHYDTQ
jgi:subtilase family serine protease